MNLDVLLRKDPEIYQSIMELYFDKLYDIDGIKFLNIEDLPVNDILILNERNLIKLPQDVKEGLEELNWQIKLNEIAWNDQMSELKTELKSFSVGIDDIKPDEYQKLIHKGVIKADKNGKISLD